MRCALAALILLAVALRFAGLGWGLRHNADQDERPFVENAARMATQRTLRHGFHEYPGLIFYLLVPAVALAGADPPGPSAYLAARAVIAAFGVAGVGLAFALGLREGGRGAGLLAAALLAVSPLGVVNAHEVKPDVVLGSFVLAAFLSFRRVSERLRFDVLSGLGIGAATAVKFSGALLAPAYVAFRLLAPGPRAGRIVVAAAVSVGSFFAFSPFTLLRPRAALAGMDDQLSYHYVGGSGTSEAFLDLLLVYLRVLSLDGLGIVGICLALLGVLLAGRQWRSRLPLAVLPVVALAVFSSAHVKHDRFLLPSLGVLAVLAGLGAASLAERLPRLALALAVVAPLAPLAESLGYVSAVLHPTTRDVVLDWIEGHAEPGARILCSDGPLGLDPKRYEVVPLTGEPRHDALLARHVDFVIAPQPPRQQLRLVLAAEPRSTLTGPRLSVFAVPPESRARYRAIPVEAGWLSASENPEALGQAVDGRRGTAWATLSPQRPGQWVEVRFPEAVSVGRIDLELGKRPLRRGGDVDVWLLPTSGDWRQARVVSARAPDLTQLPESNPPGQELVLLEPASVRGLRLTQSAMGERRWGFAELRVFAPED